MKNLKLFLLASLISASASASWAGNNPKKTKGRGDEPKLSIGIAVGAGIPMGNYGKKDTLAAADTSNTTGWAKTGFHFHVNAGYKFTDKVGAMIQIGGNMNGFDAAGYKAKVDPSGTGTFSGTSYYVGQYLVGPFLSLPAGDKISVNIRALFGLLTMKDSQFKESATGFSFTGQYASVSTFGYNLGAGLTYNASDKMGLSFGLDYFGGKPKFTTENSTVTFGSSTTSSTSGHHSIAMSTAIVNISVGVVLKF